jgi:hypothetical protein
MIISHRHRFIFIKTRKTAGTSVEVLRSRQCGPQDIVTPVKPAVSSHRPRNFRGIFPPPREPHPPASTLPSVPIAGGHCRGRMRYLTDLVRLRKFYNHIPARVVRGRVSRAVFDSYFKFCIERNPWDKALSHFHMMKARAGGNLSLDAYLQNGPYCLNFPAYTDADGKLLVDRVLKYERLDEELGEVLEDLGMTYDGQVGVHAKGAYRTDRRHYSDVLNSGQRERIAKVFAPEIEMHGYEFEPRS